jgi:biopolymer transport protein TolR
VRRKGKTGRKKADINITPYIDILLVLLIIFMVLQPLEMFDLEARIPDPPQKSAVQPPPAIVLSIDANFRMEINGERVRLATLGQRLFEIFSRRSGKNLFVRADEGLAFGTIAGIIDIAKGAGVADVGLMTY